MSDYDYHEPRLEHLELPTTYLIAQTAHQMRGEYAAGWQFSTTCAVGDEPFDPTKPPKGDGWVLNEFAGDLGHTHKQTTYDKPMHVVHWRRRITGPQP